VPQCVIGAGWIQARRSIRVLALDADTSVVENTILLAARQMPVNSRTKDGWPGTARAASTIHTGPGARILEDMLTTGAAGAS